MSQKTERIHLNIDFQRTSNFAGRSVEGGLPVTSPLHNLEELLAWCTDDQDDAGQAFSRASVPFNGKLIPEGSTKTLVCHDMAGGYVDDRFVQGTACSDGKWYYLENWEVIDTFVYFSHHFVTIPPVGWINSAHRNNVAVLGTLITEGDQGYNRWKSILSCDFLWRFVADKLVEIAKYYKFEGWLLNIENKIEVHHVSTVNDFVKYLTEQIHDAVPGGQVIWYDSITKDGELKWQNELNRENKEFFESCDGIFLNYGWSAESLENSGKLAKSLSRVQDVYVGIDVFGRGCYGGGGFNTVTALKVIRRYNLSAAIFAPGWVKEVLGGKDFERNQKLFWNLLSPYCNQHLPQNDGTSCFTSNFASGMSANEKILDRCLNLNEQSQMPLLSENLNLSLPVVSRNSKPYLKFSTNENCVMFRTAMTVLEGCLLVCSESERTSQAAHSPERYCLVTNIGTCLLEACQQQEEDSMFTVQYFPVKKEEERCDIWIVQTKAESFTLQKLMCTDPNKASVNLHSFAVANIKTGIPPCISQCVAPRKSDKVIKISLKDVSWSRSSHNSNQSLLLSCTLMLENLLQETPARILFCCSSSFRTELPKPEYHGLTMCGLYRVSDLEVRDPIFHGPEATLVVDVEQTSPLWCVEPDRFGRLIITYSENTKPAGVLRSDDFVFIA